MSESQGKSNGRHGIMHYWPVIVAVIVTITGYGALQQRVSAAEEAVEKVELKQEAQATQVQQTAVTVAQTKVEVQAVKDQVKNANDKLDRLLERSR